MTNLAYQYSMNTGSFNWFAAIFSLQCIFLSQRDINSSITHVEDSRNFSIIVQQLHQAGVKSLEYVDPVARTGRLPFSHN